MWEKRESSEKFNGLLQVQNYLLRLVLDFLSSLSEKSRFGDRSYSGKTVIRK